MDWFKVLTSFSKVKLTGGLAGRICTVVLVVCLLMVLAAASTRNPYLIGGAIVFSFLFGFPLLWRVIDFADKYPEVAMLDGAQIVRLQEIRERSKGSPSIGHEAAELMQEKPVVLRPNENPSLPDDQAVIVPINPGELRGR